MTRARPRDDVDAGAVVAELERTGYAIVPDVLDEAELADIRAELGRLLAATPTGTSSFVGFRTKRIFSVPAKTRVTDAMAAHPLVLEVLDRVLTHYLLSAPVVIEIQPGEVAQTLHRDETTYPIRHHDGGELVLNVMWAIDDFTAENGATRVIPESHRWSKESTGAGEPTVQAVMPAGSACIFLGSLLHGGGANRSDAPRLGVVMEYAASWLRPQENLTLAVPPDVARTLPPRLTELLGYDMYPPFMGYVDGRHPRELLNGRGADV